MRAGSAARRSWQYLVCAVALAGALGVTVTTPGDRRTQAPFPVSGVAGETLIGRDLAATVHSVTSADTLQVDDGRSRYPVPSSGRWIVVDASVSGVRTGTGTLQNATLALNSDTYSATSRVGSGVGLIGAELQPGVRERGMLIFEVPAPAGEQDGAAEVWLARNVDDRLDTQIRVKLDLGTAVHRQSVTAVPPVIT